MAAKVLKNGGKAKLFSRQSKMISQKMCTFAANSLNMTHRFIKPRFFFVLTLLGIQMLIGQALQAETVSERLEKKANISLATNTSTYRFNYPSVDSKGLPIVLSAGVAVWDPADSDEKQIETVLITGHSTFTQNSMSPSLYEFYGIPTNETGLLHSIVGMKAKKYPSLGRCLMIIPDYEGYGITADRPHPYMILELTARQVTDAVEHGLKLYQKAVEEGECLPLSKNWKSFCIGYSQGAAVSLAVQRYMEQHGLVGKYHLAGSCCGDGPYDIISTMNYYLHDDGDSFGVSTDHKKGQCRLPLTAALTFKSMCEQMPGMEGHKISDYISKKFLDTGIIQMLDSKELSPGEIKKVFYKVCQEGLKAADGTVYTAEEMRKMFPVASSSVLGTEIIGDMKELMTPACFEYLNNPENLAQTPTDGYGDPMKDLHRAMAANSFINDGWVPQLPISIFHSKHDTVVPYCNYLNFAETHPFANIRHTVHCSLGHVLSGVDYFALLTTNGEAVEHIRWIAEETTTGIHSKKVRRADGKYHDLNGRSTDQVPQRGFYIYLNKKYVAK